MENEKLFRTTFTHILLTGRLCGALLPHPVNESRDKNGDHDRLQNKQRDKHVSFGIIWNGMGTMQYARWM